MFIEAVTVCIDFADYLVETLPHNREQFDRYVVVTSEADKATQRVCADWRVRVVLTERHKDNGAPFNKGRAINDGIAACGPDSWICHLDADIWLPEGLRERLPQHIAAKCRRCNSNNCIFGMQRLMCDSYAAWAEYLWDENASRFPPETRRRDHDHLPVGFFQLWHASVGRKYPENFSTAGYCDGLKNSASDLEFSRQWKPGCRKHFDEYCIHLSTEQFKGQNWGGRVSSTWMQPSRVR